MLTKQNNSYLNKKRLLTEQSELNPHATLRGCASRILCHSQAEHHPEFGRDLMAMGGSFLKTY